MSILTKTLMMIGLVVAVATLALSLIGMIARWNTPKRRTHAVRSVFAVVAIFFIYGVHFANLFLVELPALGRERQAEIIAAREQKIAETSIIQTGDASPEFTLKTTAGDSVHVPDTGNVVLIVFFTTSCGRCEMELPHLQKIWADNKGQKNFRMLGIGRDENFEALQNYCSEMGLSFPISADPDRQFYSLFATELIPRTLVVSPSGRIVYSKTGYQDGDIDELNGVLRKQFASSDTTNQ